MRSGGINAGGFSAGVGLANYAWSSRSAIETIFQNADYLGFYEAEVGPSIYDSRSIGFSLRCLIVGKV